MAVLLAGGFVAAWSYGREFADGSPDARRGNLGVDLSQLAWAALAVDQPGIRRDVNAILTTMAFPSDVFVVD